jgi:hypothetical protein
MTINIKTVCIIIDAAHTTGSFGNRRSRSSLLGSALFFRVEAILKFCKIVKLSSKWPRKIVAPDITIDIRHRES